MKKLLFFSLLGISFLSLYSCGSKKSNAKEQSLKEVETTKTIEHTMHSTESKVKSGKSVSSQSGDTLGGSKNEHRKEVEIKHGVPNQSELDSIKREKTRKKR